MRVAVLADPDAIEQEVSDLRWVTGALRDLGHEISVVPFGPRIADTIERLSRRAPRVVFNFAETFDRDRRKAAHAAALLELLGIPYTGSGPLAQALAIDKARSKQLLRLHGVPVPEFFVVPPGGDPPRRAGFPLFVKPLHGGGKEGITDGCLVRSRAALAKRVGLVHRAWKQPAICERYIEGRELTQAILGNARLEFLPLRELVFRDPAGAGPRFLTDQVLTNAKLRARWHIEMVDAALPARVHREVQRVAEIAYRAIGLTGYGRLDMRLGTDGLPYVLEVNANPAVRPPHGSFLQPWGGIAYEALIERILRLALERRRRWS